MDAEKRLETGKLLEINRKPYAGAADFMYIGKIAEGNVYVAEFFDKNFHMFKKYSLDDPAVTGLDERSDIVESFERTKNIVDRVQENIMPFPEKYTKKIPAKASA